MLSGYETKANRVTLRNTASVSIHGVAPGATVTLKADRHGSPSGPENVDFRRRLKDGSFVIVNDDAPRRVKKAVEAE